MVYVHIEPYHILISTIRQTVISRIVRQTIWTQFISGYYGGDLMDSFQGSRIWWREGCRVGVWKVRRVRAGLLVRPAENDSICTTLTGTEATDGRPGKKENHEDIG